MQASTRPSGLTAGQDSCQGDSSSHRQSMPERPCILLHPKDVTGGMADVVRAVAVQGFKVFFGKETPVG